jgi:hypothetical protein
VLENSGFELPTIEILTNTRQIEEVSHEEPERQK